MTSPAWQLKLDPTAQPQADTSLATHLHCPPAIAHILATRGIATPSAAEAFLKPHLSQLHNPTLLLGMDRAIARILEALRNDHPILLYGDYDVDGTTAIVLLKTAIELAARALDPTKPARVTYHVPHRIREGYGMQSSVLAAAAAEGIRLVISVDTGIRAFAEAAEARTLGLDLIVTDHHLPEGDSADISTTQIPDCLAVINPTQPGCTYPNKHLCGAAVAFKLAHALLLAAAPSTPDPAAFITRTNTLLVPSFLKLVAIATIADSVPLTGENRTIVSLGLAALANPIQPGLRALMEVAQVPLDRAPTASEVGFRIAPRINAAGRMDIASDVVELFLTRDPGSAQALAEKLDALNTARRDSEASALSSIEQRLAELLDEAASPDAQTYPADVLGYPADVIILDHPDWHRGVLGILASRVVERTGRPALVLTHADGQAHGSGRSIPGFHLLDALTSAQTSPETSGPATPLFSRFGGHAYAVGFSLPSSSLAELRTRISAHSIPRLTQPILAPPILYDAELTLADLTLDFCAWLQRLAPFGASHHEPLFFTRSLTLASPIRLIKDRHLCLELTHPLTQRKTISALGWSRNSTDWPTTAARLNLTQGSSVDLLYRLRRNTGSYANPAFAGLELELHSLRATTEISPL